MLDMRALHVEITNKVSEVLQHKGEIAAEQDLAAIGLDSMRSVGLVVGLEEMYNIEYDDEELLTDNFSTIAKIVERVNSKLSLS